jgi:hypothetical protein
VAPPPLPSVASDDEYYDSSLPADAPPVRPPMMMSMGRRASAPAYDPPPLPPQFANMPLKDNYDDDDDDE